MNWKFWQKPAKEEETMGLYLSRDETPEQAWRSMFAQTEPNPDEGEEEQPAAEETDEPADPLATAPPEIQAAVEARLAQERQSIRASLARQGIDLTADGQPAIRDARRLQEWSGAPQYAPPPAERPAPAAERPAPAPAPEEEEPIPDPQYDPAGYRRWHQRELTRATAEAVQAALEPVVQQLKQVRQVSVESRVESAVGRVAEAVEYYTPWLSGALSHPDFEATFRQALAQVEPEKWTQPQDLCAVAAMAASYLPPLDPSGAYEAAAPRPRALRPPAPNAGPPAPAAPPRNPQGQFVRSGQAVGRAAIGRAAAEQTAPSRSSGRVPVQPQYDEILLQAAERAGISPEEARLTMQDSTGDAAEQLRRQRLGRPR